MKYHHAFIYVKKVDGKIDVSIWGVHVGKDEKHMLLARKQVFLSTWKKHGDVILMEAKKLLFSLDVNKIKIVDMT